MIDDFSEKTSFIRSVADLLRGLYRPNKYKDVIRLSEAPNTL